MSTIEAIDAGGFLIILVVIAFFCGKLYLQNRRKRNPYLKDKD